MKRFVVKHSKIMIFFLALGMLCTLFVCWYAVRDKMISDYNAVIGKMYKENEELAEKTAAYLYGNDLSLQNQELGKEAMKKLGYTEGGMLLAKTFDREIYQIAGGVLTVFFLLLIVVLFLQKQEKKLFLQEEEERIRERVAQANRGEQMLLEKKKAMTQTYVENVAHQVRTPLTNAMLNLALVQDKQSEEDKAILEECTYHIERVNKLMERLLKIGRLEAGKVEFAKQKDNLATLLQKLGKSYREEQVKTDLPDVTIYFDREWLYEAFSCLIENCLEHVGAGCEVQVCLTATEDVAVITVEDNGEGFREEEIPYLFERFYSSDGLKATGHYGIGLNLAKLVIEQHFGKISAYNRTDGGAGFRVELPRYKLK